MTRHEGGRAPPAVAATPELAEYCHGDIPPAAARAIRLTLAGLWWEESAHAFWPAATLAALGTAVLVLGLVAVIPPVTLGWVAGGWALLLAAALVLGWRRFRRPRAAQARARVDAALTGRPLAALGDRMALGGAGADGLWRAHLAAARAAARGARAVVPDAGLRRRDPFALRLAALTALAMAMIFGGAGPAGQGLAALAATWKPGPRATTPFAAGPSWEGWAEPPRYTRKPAIYLNALPDDALTVPKGTKLVFRLYGEGARVEQDVGTALDTPPEAPAFTATRDGTIRVGGRGFAVTVLPDEAPAVTLAAAAQRRADGRLAQGFAATDDNGIATGRAEIALDLNTVDRHYGLAVAPEPREPLVLDLPLPGAGARQDVRGVLAADLARHPWANLPVTVTLRVSDDIGQQAATPATPMILPGRGFFDPLAAALVEIRRDLLWSRANGPRSAQILRALAWRQDAAVPAQAARAIAGAVTALESGALTPEVRDGLAQSLWEAAIAIEDGGLSDALERMRKAQEKLSEAIRNGASPDEIRKLMDELKAATDAYTEMLAQQGEDPAEKFDRSDRQGQRITGDQIQAMMDEIQRLMNEGRMAEAQELLDQFNRMMENLKVTQGAQGEGGSRPMARLGEALREQQRLADEAMRQAQDPFGQGADPGQSQPGQDGQQGQPGEGGEGSLADRQGMLRQELGRQRGLLPGRGTERGEAAGGWLDEAGRAMEDAEQALREGDPAGALERQADAIEAMREGMRALGDLAREQAGQGGQQGDQQQGENGQQPGGSGSPRQGGGDGMPYSRGPSRDPLGRETSGQGGTVTTGEPLNEGERQAGRARDLQDEIRRRSGEQGRPRDERDYLGRLLERF